MTTVPEHLDAAEKHLAEAFEHLHRRNNDTGQTDPHLREAVAACSAALAQVRRAAGHAAHVYAEEKQ